MLRSEFVALWTRPLWQLIPAIPSEPLGADDLSFRFEPMTIQACHGWVTPVGLVGLHDLVKGKP